MAQEWAASALASDERFSGEVDSLQILTLPSVIPTPTVLVASCSDTFRHGWHLYPRAFALDIPSGMCFP